MSAQTSPPPNGWLSLTSWSSEALQQNSEGPLGGSSSVHNQGFIKSEDGSTSLSDEEGSTDHSLSTVPMGHTSDDRDFENERWGCNPSTSRKSMRIYYCQFAVLLLFTHGLSMFVGSRLQQKVDSSKPHATNKDILSEDEDNVVSTSPPVMEDVIPIESKDDIEVTIIPEEDILEQHPTHAPAHATDGTKNPTILPVATGSPTASPVTTESPTASPVATENPTASPVATESPTVSTVTAETESASPTAVLYITPAGPTDEIIVTFPTDGNEPVAPETSNGGNINSVQEKEAVEGALGREIAFINIINEISSDGGSSVIDMSSPQNSALRYLVEEDISTVDPADTSEANQIHIIQRYALLSLYYAMSDSSDATLMDIQDGFGGDIILANEGNWGVEHECTWFGVECDGGTINSLLLHYTDLNGMIPPELALLSNLKILDLSSNYIEGTVPDIVYESLTKLEKISLRDNYLNGTIPVSIKQLNLLQTIDFGESDFHGPIPEEIGELSQLRELLLDNSAFDGALPTEIGNCRDLQVIDLHYNFLEGPLPSEIGMLALLEELYVSANFFSGEIPVEYGTLSNTKVFWNYHNDMTGVIPNELSGMYQLESLRLGRNAYEKQTIPDFIYNVQSLVDLNMEDSSLEGELSTNLGQLVSLKTLELDDNEISGLLPSEIGSLTSLEHLEIDGNSLSGWLPTEFGLLVDLTSLSMAGNFLGWEIPSEIGNLINLNVLSLNYNWLSGTLPDEITKLEELEYLDLTYNYLNGTLPQNIGKMTSLLEFRAAIQSDVEAETEGFHGKLPVSIGHLENIEVFEVFYNSLSGEIPSEIGLMGNLLELNLEYNFFSGTVPSELQQLESLIDLYLADNDLTGSVPQPICDIGASISIDCTSVDCDCCTCEALTGNS